MLHSFFAGIGIFLATIFGGQPIDTVAPVRSQPAAAIVALADNDRAADAAPSTSGTASNATTTIVNQYITQPVIERTVQTVAAPTGAYVTGNELSQRLAALSDAFARTMYGTTYPAPTTSYASGGVWNSIALMGRIENLSGTNLSSITVDGVSGLTDADIPDGLTASNYLPLSGGTLTGDISLANATSTNFFATLGHFTTGIIDSLTATAATITNLIVTTITGTNATFTNATTTNATSTNLYASNLNLGTALSVGNGGTGWSNISAGYIPFGNGASTLATSSSLFWDDTNARLGIGTTIPAYKLDVIGNASIGDSSQEGQGMYLMSSFMKNPERLVLSLSNDAAHWSPISATSTYTAPSGDLIRDPSIIRISDVYYIAYTREAGGGVTTSFGVATSKNLTDWSFLADVDTSSISGIGHTWAPEWFVDSDGSVHVFFAGGVSGSFKIYEVHPTNASLTSWASPILVSGIPSGAIDPFVVKVGSTYYLWYKFNGINYASSNSLTSGYSAVTASDNWAGWGGDLFEGPALVQISANKWRVFLDNDKGPSGPIGIYYSDSTDGWNTWTAPQPIQTGGLVLQHSTIIKITDVNSFRNAVASKLALQSNLYYEAGNVGIGTLDPSTLLEVASSTGDTTQILWNVTIRNGGNGNAIGYGAGLKLKNSSDSGTEANKWAGIAAVAGSASSNSTELSFFTNNNNTLSPTEKLRITGSGNVGIGTTTPQEKLSVGGTISTYFDTSNYGIRGVFQHNGNAGGILSAGGLQIAAQGTNKAQLGSGDINFFVTGSNSAGPYTDASYTQAMKIKYNGNVGIGTTTPWAKLSVAGAAGGTLPLFTISTSTSGFATSTAFIVSSNGLVGIGTSSPTTALQINGSITPNIDNTYTDGNATYRWNAVYSSNNVIQTSDARLKENVATTTYGLTELMQLRPVSFTWIAHPEQGIKLGFIAQEVQPILPETVNVGDDANHTLGLTYTEFVPVIVHAVQQLGQKLADFADSFTTKELTFTRATGDEIDVHRAVADELCANKSDGTPVCMNGDQLAAVLAGPSSAEGNTPAGGATPGATTTPDTTPPVITINGANPATIHVGDSYADLGATVTDNVDQNLGLKYFLNGTLVSNIVIDTSAAATDTVDYVATDQAGNTATSTRTVIVEPQVFLPPVSDATTSAATSTSQ